MQSLETKNLMPRLKSFETETRPSRPRRDLRPSRPRLQKTGFETRLETETKSPDSITDLQLGVFQHVVSTKFPDYSATIFPLVVQKSLNDLNLY